MAIHFPLVSIADSSGVPDHFYAAPFPPSLILVQMIVVTAMTVPRRPRHKSRSYWSPSVTPAKHSLLQMMLKAMKSLRMRQAQIQVMNLTLIRTQTLFLLLRKVGVKRRFPGRKSPQRHPLMSAPAPAQILVLTRRMNCQANQNTKQSRLQVQTPAPARIRMICQAH